MVVALDTRLPLAVEPVRLDLRAPTIDAVNVQGKRLANEGQALANTGAGLRNELAGMSLAETKGQYDAIKGYREAAAGGDAAALDKLKGYPELQLKFRQALEGLEDADLADAEQSLEAVARAAEVVKAAPPEMRANVWNTQLDTLLDNGAITQEQYDEHYDNPSDFVLDQAIVAAQTADELRAEREAKKKTAIETAREYPTKESELSLSQKMEIEQAIADRLKAVAGDFGFEDVAAQRKAEKRARLEVLASLGIEADLSAGPTKPKKKGAGGAEPAGEEEPGGEAKAAGPPEIGASDNPADYPRDNPANPTAENFDSLPVGAWYIDPGDGGLYQKVK